MACDECGKPNSRVVHGGQMTWRRKGGADNIENLTYTTTRRLCDRCFDLNAASMMNNSIVDLEGK